MVSKTYKNFHKKRCNKKSKKVHRMKGGANANANNNSNNNNSSSSNSNNGNSKNNNLTPNNSNSIYTVNMFFKKINNFANIIIEKFKKFNNLPFSIDSFTKDYNDFMEKLKQYFKEHRQNRFMFIYMFEYKYPTFYNLVDRFYLDNKDVFNEEDKLFMIYLLGDIQKYQVKFQKKYIQNFQMIYKNNNRTERQWESIGVGTANQSLTNYSKSHRNLSKAVFNARDKHRQQQENALLHPNITSV